MGVSFGLLSRTRQVNRRLKMNFMGLLTIGLSCLVLTSLNAPTFGPGTAIVAVPAGIAIAGPLGAGIIPTSPLVGAAVLKAAVLGKVGVLGALVGTHLSRNQQEENKRGRPHRRG